MLLDTHSLLWVLDGGGRLGAEARALIQRSTDVSCSAVSLAEIRIKELLGRLVVPPDLLDRIRDAGIVVSSFGADAAEGLIGWPSLTRHDPFGRMLLAQAMAAHTALLTADRVLLALPDAPVVDARR